MSADDLSYLVETATGGERVLESMDVGQIAGIGRARLVLTEYRLCYVDADERTVTFAHDEIERLEVEPASALGHLRGGISVLALFLLGLALLLLFNPGARLPIAIAVASIGLVAAFAAALYPITKELRVVAPDHPMGGLDVEVYFPDSLWRCSAFERRFRDVAGR